MSKPDKTPTAEGAEKFRIELAYPPKELSPNARVHYQVRARVGKKYREYVGWSAKQMKPSKSLKITFHPRSRLQDFDNVISSFKFGQDGLSDAWGINDREFFIQYELSHPVKGGKVIVESVI